ncbi:MAG: serine/threonine-protein kinase, partial [Planctomycetota bacterium]
MTDDLRDDVEEIAERFVALLRSGASPSVSEFEREHPQHAKEIRELFPALIVMEQFGSVENAAGEANSLSSRLANSVPNRLGEYRILRQIGRGGMGVVFEAVHQSLGREVALKVLPSTPMDGKTQVTRFRREARAAARLHHTNIVPVFDVGSQGNFHFYAMQLIRGQSLDEVLVEVHELRKSQQMAGTTNASSLSGETLLALADSSNEHSDGSESSKSQSSESTSIRPYFRQVARVGQQIAEAVAHAHAQGVLHRDIKPSNVLLNYQGTAWITDFGLAKSDQVDAEDLTHSRGIVGTVCYMAPERFAGESSRQTDIYGIGTTLYEMLTLRPVFAQHDRLKLMQSISNDEPISPREIDPAIPRDLETIVLKCLEKEPNRRYKSAGELASDLCCVLADRPIAARRTSLSEKFRRWCRRNPAVASLTAAVILLLSTFAIGSFSAAAIWRHQRNVVRDQKIQISVEKSAAEDARRDAVERLRAAQYAFARTARFSQQLGRRSKSLDAIAKAAAIRPGFELRTEAISAFSMVDFEQHESWLGMPYDFSLQAIDFAPNHDVYACQIDHGVIAIREADADAAILLKLPKQRDSSIARVRFDPTGRWLGAVCYRQSPAGYYVVVWDWAVEGCPEVYRNEEPGLANRLSYSTNGLQIATAFESGTIQIIDLATGQTARTLEVGGGVGAIEFSPLDDSLAVSTVGREMLIWRHSESQTPDHRFETKSYVMAMAWSPDGKSVAAGCKDRRIRLWEVATQTMKGELLGHSSECAAVHYHPSGDFLLSAGWDGKTLLWNQKESRVIGVENGFAIGFSKDGQRVAIEHGRKVATYRVQTAP